MDEITVPSHLRILGEEAQRLHELLVEHLDATDSDVLYEAGTENMADACSRMMPQWESGLQALTHLIQGPLQAQAARSDGDDAAMQRLAGRLEQALMWLLSLYDDAQALRVEPGEDYPKYLLVEGLADVLRQIDHPLEHMALILGCPDAFTEELVPQENGKVEWTLNIKLDFPDELKELANYLEQTARQHSPANGWLWAVMGAFVLGSLFGTSNDDCSR